MAYNLIARLSQTYSELVNLSEAQRHSFILGILRIGCGSVYLSVFRGELVKLTIAERLLMGSLYTVFIM